MGGGEAGPPTSYKLSALDSAHVEILRIGTYRPDWGGLDREHLLEVMASGSIKIPQIEVLPTDVIEGDQKPPELEIRFDMTESSPKGKQLQNLQTDNFEAFCREPLPTNWQLRFLHNQLFKTFVYPSRFCPGAFHSTILRKAEFRSEHHRARYFKKCETAIANWYRRGPQPLNTIPRHLNGVPLTREEIKASQAAKDAEEHLEKFSAAIRKQDSNDTDFKEPTEEDEEAVAELVDKLAEMAKPLPPNATTVRATTNLEVSLDEGNGDASSDSDSDNDDDLEEYPADEISKVATDAADDAAATTNTDTQSATKDDHFMEGSVVDSETAATDDAFATESLLHSQSIDTLQGLTTKQAMAAGDSPEDVCHSGIWLFTDRENITHFFKPNFLPPYDSREKRKIIFDVLKEEWDEKSLSWKCFGEGSMTIKKYEHEPEGNVLQKVVSAVIDGVCFPEK